MDKETRERMLMAIEEAKAEHNAKIVERVKETRPDVKEIDKDESKTSIEKIAKDAIYAGAITSLQDQDYQEKVKAQARQALGTQLNTQQNILDKDEQETLYDSNSEACDAFGINKGVPTWQIKMMRLGHAIWFCIYYVVAFLTVCPLTIFTKMLVHFVKKNWIALILAILIWAAIVFSPFIIMWVNKINGAEENIKTAVESLTGAAVNM